MRMLNSVFNKENLVKIRCINVGDDDSPAVYDDIMDNILKMQMMMMRRWLLEQWWRRVETSTVKCVLLPCSTGSCLPWSPMVSTPATADMITASTSSWEVSTEQTPVSEFISHRDITHREKFSVLLSSYSVAAASVKSYIIRLLRRNNLNFSER